MDRKLSWKLLEYGLDAFFRSDGNTYRFNLIKSICPGRSLRCRIGIKIRHILHNGKAHLASRNDISDKIMHRKSSRLNFKRRMTGRRSGFIYSFILLVIKREGQHIVCTCKKFQLVASQSVFGCFIIGSTQNKSLGDEVAFILEGNSDLRDILEVFQAVIRRFGRLI